MENRSPDTGPSAPPGLHRGLALVAGLTRPHAWRLLFVFLLSLIATGFALLQPYLTKFLIDDGILAGNLTAVMTVAAAIVAVGFVGAALGLLNRQLYVDLSARVLFALRRRVYDHLLRLSPRFYARRKTGDLISRLDGDVAEVQRFALDSLLAAVNASLMLIGCLAFMISLSPMLTAIAFILLPAQALFLRAIRPRLGTQTATLRRRAAAISSYLIERLGAVRLIQALSREDREQALLDRHQDDYRQDLLRVQKTSYLAGAGPSLMMTVSTAVVFIAGGREVIEGRLSLGTLIAFAAYLGRAAGPVQTFLGLYAASIRAEVSLGRIYELLDEKPEVSSPPEPLSLPAQATGDLRLEAVSFAHAERAAPVLESVDAHFPAGRKIALSGDSGAGKSTLADLLLRYFDPDGGRITLDGIDLRHLDLGDLRRRLAVVSQETLLFHGSLADNLRLARADATDQDLDRVLRAARLDGLLARLPDGLHTLVGTRGTSLSGGERQRLAIARALLQDPLVILFDEATAGVDAATEAEILAEIDRLFAGRTRIIISHHGRSLSGADHVFELRAGKLVENTGS